MGEVNIKRIQIHDPQDPIQSLKQLHDTIPKTLKLSKRMRQSLVIEFIENFHVLYHQAQNKQVKLWQSEPKYRISKVEYI